VPHRHPFGHWREEVGVLKTWTGLPGMMVGVGLVVSLTGCFNDDPPAATDSGVTDTGVSNPDVGVDAGPADTGMADVGPVDAGGHVHPDTGPVDVQMPVDTGPMVDAGPVTVPAVQVVSPVTGSTFAIGVASPLRLAVMNFTLQDFNGSPPDGPDRGHYHIYLDNADGADYLVAAFATDPSITIPVGTSPGMHSLRVSLRRNNHDPLMPPRETVLPIRVVANAAPRVTVLTPADNSSIAAGAMVSVTLQTQNFMLRDFNGQSGVTPGMGHYHIYLDDATGSDYLVADHRTMVPVTVPAGTSAGPHRLVFSLRNDDHSEVTEGGAFTLRINVTR